MKIDDNFKPDISTKKKREIIERAYYFALSFKEKRMCTREKFKEKFGNNTRNLFKWSMKYLMSCTNGFYSKDAKKAKEYVRNPIGIAYLSQFLEGKTEESFLEFVSHYDEQNIIKYYLPEVYLEEEFGKPLRAQRLKYEMIGHRFYNPLQSIEKSIRNPFLAQNGFTHDYDIECCNITLLLQYAEQCYQELLEMGDTSLVSKVNFNGLYEYKADRKAARKYIAEKFCMKEEDAKELFTALINGSNLSYVGGKLVKKHGQDLCYKLKSDQFMKRFISGVASIWRVITRHGVMTNNDKRGNRAILKDNKVVVVKKKFDAAQKADFYFMLESIVVKLYSKFLKDNKIKFFMIHDGFVSNRLVDTFELRKFIKKESGFDVSFSHEILSLK